LLGFPIGNENTVFAVAKILNPKPTGPVYP
jgi:hypothetical protein